MAIVTSGAAYPLDFRLLDVTSLLIGTATTHTSTSLVVDYGGGERDEFSGAGLTYNALGEPISGVINAYRNYSAGVLAAQVTGLSASAAEFMGYVKNADTAGAIFLMLAGDDQISGSAFADYIAGGAGNDIISGFGGDDSLIWNGGNDVFQGGAGTDTVIVPKALADVALSKTATGWTVSVTGSSTASTLVDVERLKLNDVALDLSAFNTQVETYSANILRTSSSALSMLVGNGAMSTSAALSQITASAGATTSVATLAYEFFTGKIPGGPGYDFLVSPTGPNANNLNSPYYQTFNLENRYINFAVNLGKNGEGQAKFASEYGGLSLPDATKKAYGVIFGTTPTDTKVAALLADGRDAYFDSYGHDGLNGVGTKAAMVGWLLAEAVKADVGMYAKANDAFLTDLVDGATYGVDLIGVYGKPEFNLT